MYKKIIALSGLLFLMCTILIVGCGADVPSQKKKKNEVKSSDFEEREYIKAKNFKIKKRMATSYFYNNNGKLQERGTKVEEVTYYENGALHEVIRFTSTGQIDLKWTYKYDLDGNILSLETINEYGMVFYKRESHYKNGYETRRYEKDYGQKYEVNISYEYDDRGNMIEETAKDMKGELFSRVEYEYKNDRIMKITSYNRDDKLTLIKENTYDEVGNRIREILTYPSTTIDTVTYKYDERKNILEMDQGYFLQKYVFDERENMLSQEWYSKGVDKQGTFKFIYDDRGLVVERIRMDSLDEPVIYTRYEYEFY
ncbi:MAG: hypothetical protein V1720_02370 [bacterium]